VTHADALLRKLYEKAVKGDLKATQLLLDMFAAALQRRNKDLPSDGPITELEQTLLDELLANYLPTPRAGVAE
jgi:hypothetical protein